MRILLLSQWYPPEPQELISDLAESLRNCGHEVTVLTGFPNYPSGKIYPGYRLGLYQREDLNGIPVIRVPLYPNHSHSAFKRVLNYVSFAVAATLLGAWLVPRVDVVYVIHPPLSVAGPAWVLSRLLGVPFAYDIQDMWPETLRATGMLNSDRVLGFVGWIAKWVYRRAAAIRVISPGFRDNLVGKGVPAAKIHVVSNWVDTEFYQPTEANALLAERVGLTGGFNVMFAGVIGMAQGLETVLHAAALLKDLPDVRFVLVGDGADLQRLQAQARDERLNNVRFLGRYPAEDMSGLYALADVLLIHLRNDPLFRITIPHKTFAYLASAKPILAAVEGDVADVIIQANAGLTCPPSNPQALATTVRRLYHMSAEQRREYGENGRLVACRCYSRSYLVPQVAKVLEQITRERRRKRSRERAHSSIENTTS